MPDSNTPTGATQENAPADPSREAVRFAVSYANVYVDLVTGEVELGARVYHDPANADNRRLTHPTRAGLEFVGVFPVAACIAETVRQACIARGRAAQENRERIAREQAEAAARAAEATPAEHGEEGVEPDDGDEDDTPEV